MCELQSTNGHIIFLDQEDLEWAATMTWTAWEIRGKLYARNQKNKYMHRLISGVTKRTEEVDHINGDSLDNRRKNLRVVTHKQNQENRAYSYGQCGVRGVTMTKHGRYQAAVKINGKRLYFGTYDTIEEAGEAALQGRLKYMTHSDPHIEGVERGVSTIQDYEEARSYFRCGVHKKDSEHAAARSDGKGYYCGTCFYNGGAWRPEAKRRRAEAAA